MPCLSSDTVANGTVNLGTRYDNTVPPRYNEVGEARAAFHLEGIWGATHVATRGKLIERLYPDLKVKAEE